jgi:hypothetical protein
MTRLTVLLVALTALLLPGGAEACAVCGPGTEESRIAFIVTTGLLTAAPLLLVGGAFWWLRRRLVEMQREAERHQAEAAARSASTR